MTRACSLATVLLLVMFLSPAAAAETPQARISHINDLAVGREPVQVERHRKVALRGTLVVDGAPDEVTRLTLRALIIRRYDGHMWVTPKASLERPVRGAKTKTWNWRIDDAELPLSELGGGYDVQVVTFSGDSGLSGMSDRETVRRLAVALGAVVQLHVGVSGEAPLVTGACAVRIDTIENVFGREVSAAGPDIEVGLQSALRGTVDAPAGTFLYTAVRADGSEDVWIMPSKISRYARGYRGTFYSGRDGYDWGENFTVQMLMSRHPIRDGRSYAPPEWRAIEPSICASSRDVVVRRRVSPGDLRITEIDYAPVTSGTTPIETTTEPQVTGQITDLRPHNRLDLDESVYLLSRRRGTEGWTVSAIAVVHDDRLGWRIPSLRLSEPGTYSIIAIAARTRLTVGRVLDNADWYRLTRLRLARRLSKAVLIKPTRES